METHIPIIVLPGWCTTSEKYLELLRSLQKYSYNISVLDMPGFGKVPHRGRPLHLTDYVDYLESYRKRCKVTRFILIGHSFGGRLALLYQKQFPTRVSALILSGTPGFLPVRKEKWLVSLIISKIGNVFFRLPFISRYTENVRVWFYKIVGAMDFYRADPLMRQTFKNVIAEELHSAMAAIRVPTLLIWGKQDKIVPVSVGIRMAEKISGSRLVIIEDAGHMWKGNQTEVFAKAVSEFLSSV